jgi:hypothetical protein
VFHPLFQFRSGPTFTLQDGQHFGSPLFRPAEYDDQTGFDELVMLVALAGKCAVQAANHQNVLCRLPITCTWLAASWLQLAEMSLACTLKRPSSFSTAKRQSHG